jgi:hypothetical protein
VQPSVGEVYSVSLQTCEVSITGLVCHFFFFFFFMVFTKLGIIKRKHFSVEWPCRILLTLPSRKVVMKCGAAPYRRLSYKPRCVVMVF